MVHSSGNRTSRLGTLCSADGTFGGCRATPSPQGPSEAQVSSLFHLPRPGQEPSLEAIPAVHPSEKTLSSCRLGQLDALQAEEERVVLWTSTASTSPRKSWSGTTPPPGWKGSGSGRAGRSR